MWLVLAVALFTADTRLYNSGCAPLDTASAVIPLAEFRSVIAHLEERQSLLVELAACQDLIALQTKQLVAQTNALTFDSVALAAQRSSTALADSARKEVVVQVQQVKREAASRSFWRGLATGVALSATLSLLMAIAAR